MPDTSFTIRKVRRDEGAALAELSRRTFIDTFGANNEPANLADYVDRAFAPATILAELRTPGSEFHFAEVTGRPIGYLKLNTGPAQTEPVPGNALEIERIYLAKEGQGLGLGKALLGHALLRAREEMCETVWLGVWERNTKAIAFYERQGFRAFGSHDFVIGADRQTDILMQIHL